MNLESKLNEYKNNIDELKSIESLEVYRWLMSLGEKLNDDPLSKEKRIEINKVKKILPVDVDYRRIEFVGPKVGQELKIMGLNR